MYLVIYWYLLLCLFFVNAQYSIAFCVRPDCFCVYQISQWHPGAHEGGGDGLAQTVLESRNPVSEWWAAAAYLFVSFWCHVGTFGKMWFASIVLFFLMHLHILSTEEIFHNKHFSGFCHFPVQSLKLLFQFFLFSGHYDKCVFALREENKGDMANVLNYIFSHAQVTKKNLLVTMLIVSFWLIVFMLLTPSYAFSYISLVRKKLNSKCTGISVILCSCFFAGNRHKNFELL